MTWDARKIAIGKDEHCLFGSSTLKLKRHLKLKVKW
jgi:hypothetical protein